MYGISIFTHMVHLIDTWLMEFRRILAPGGLAVFTVHDENTLRFFEKEGDGTNPWVSNDQVAGGLKDDVVVLCDAKAPFWGSVFTFFRTDRIADEWGKYLDVVAIEPFAAHTRVLSFYESRRASEIATSPSEQQDPL